ncbi:MAG: HD domain-containing phosphohydrolase, partial [Actinomycetota bacterium]
MAIGTVDTGSNGRWATAPEGGRWTGRPRLARAVRLGVVLVPFGIATLVAILLSSTLPMPSTLAWLVARIAFVSIVAAVAYRQVERVVRRALPLASLLDLSLHFPGQAPSRLAITLRVASTTDLSLLLSRYRETGADEPAAAAEHLLELVAALSKHDRVTRGHSERVRAYTQMLGEELGLGGVELDRLRWAGLIHDIGKLRIDEAILNKPGRLTDDEFAIIKTHPTLGAELAAPLAGWLGESVNAVAQHHERWDGRGYPRGLRGEEISFAARIVSVADTFDVITSVRSYRHASSAQDAVAELGRCAGSQFDPAVVRAFLSLPFSSIRRVMGPLSVALPVLLGPRSLLPTWRAAGSTAGSGSSTPGSSATAVGTTTSTTVPSALPGALQGAASSGATTAATVTGSAASVVSATTTTIGSVAVGAGATMSSSVGLAVSLSVFSGVIATGVGTVVAFPQADAGSVAVGTAVVVEVPAEAVAMPLSVSPVVVSTVPTTVHEAEVASMGPVPQTAPMVVVDERPSSTTPMLAPPSTTPPGTTPPSTTPPSTTPPVPPSVPAPSTSPPPSVAPVAVVTAPLQHTLNIALVGSGTGTVGSTPVGIDCGSTCSSAFEVGTSVTLTATPGVGSVFTGWSGSCSGKAPTCTLSMNAARSVTAGFSPSTWVLTAKVLATGAATGTVTSNVGGIDCASLCSADIRHGTS